MVNHMYWIVALLFAVLLGLVFYHDVKNKKKSGNASKKFRDLLIWVIFFCVQDCMWGLCEAGLIRGEGIFFLVSSVFHLSTVVTTFFWLYYILSVLDYRVKHKKIYLAIDGLVIFFEACLVAMNFFTPTLFSIKNGVYHTEYLRSLTFINQYAVYIIIGIATLLQAIKERGKERERFRSVFFFALAPILMGAFQLLFPEGPFYSMGYFIGCFVIHLFVVSKDMEEYANRQLRENAYLDSLTGLLNRRAYERDFSETLDKRADSNLVFGSLDMNGLKTINDTVGHEAGDEMIIGAAQCMQQALGSYGNIYRTGGDEFNAIIFATPDQLKKIKSDLEDCIEGWTGDLAANISVAFGFVHINEIENPTMKALSLEADKRMYNEKRKYYTRNGVDRRSLRDAHVALCHLYTKILKVNLTEDSYVIVDVDESEVAADKGFSESISEWLSSFGTTGMVHQDDLEDYLGKTNIEYLRNYFRNGNKIIRINYRRKVSGTYKHVTMEMIPANDYTDNNQSLYLYVKTMED